MITAELRKFFQDNIQKGYSTVEISQSLVAGGWKESDALAAVSEFANEQNATAGVSFVPESSTAVLPKEEPSGYAGLRKEEPPSVAAIVAVSPSSAVALPPDALYFPPTRSKWVFPSIVILLVLLVGAAGASGYYFLVKKTLSPDIVLLNMKDAMGKVHAYSFDSKFSVDIKAKPKGDLLQQVNQLGGKGTEGALKFSVSTKGAMVGGVSATTTDVDVSYDTDGSASYGAVSFVLDGEASIRTVEGKLFVRLMKIPQLLSTFGMNKTLSPWENKWISFDPKASSSLSGIVSMSIAEGASSALTKENREQVTQIFTKNLPITLSVPSDSTVSVDGVDTYHYAFTVDKNRLASLFAELSTFYPKEALAQDPVTVKESIDSAVELLAGMTGDLYIGKNDFYLYRANVHVPVAVIATSIEVSGTIDFEMTGLLFNATPQIVAPENSTPAEEVYAAVMQKVLGRPLPTQDGTSVNGVAVGESKTSTDADVGITASLEFRPTPNSKGASNLKIMAGNKYYYMWRTTGADSIRERVDVTNCKDKSLNGTTSLQKDSTAADQTVSTKASEAGCEVMITITAQNSKTGKSSDVVGVVTMR